MTRDHGLDELLRVVEDPLPLRRDREERLLDQLLGDLEKGRFTAPFAAPADAGFTTTVDEDDGPAEIVAIELSRIGSSFGSGCPPAAVRSPSSTCSSMRSTRS